MGKITLLKERKNGYEGLWKKLTGNPNFRQACNFALSCFYC